MNFGDVMPSDDYWKDPKVLQTHAKRRREKYANDPELRKAEKARQRVIYRKKQGADFKNPARDVLAAGLDEPNYSASEISELIGRAPEYINRLIVRGMWPDPRPQPSDPAIFSREATERLLAVLADHIDNVASTYRVDHEETTEALFAAWQNKP